MFSEKPSQTEILIKEGYTFSFKYYKVFLRVLKLPYFDTKENEIWT